MNHRQYLGPMSTHRVGDLVGLEHAAPLGFDRFDARVTARRDLHQQVPETPEHRHQHRIPRRDQGCQTGFDTGSGRAVDQQRPLIVGTKHLPVQHHDLVHVGGKLWIELTQHGCCHAMQYRRIDVDRTRTHQQSW